MVFRLINGEMRRYTNPTDEMNAVIADEKLHDVSKLGMRKEVKSEAT